MDMENGGFKLYEEVMAGLVESQKAQKGDFLVGDILYCGRCKTPRRRYEMVGGKSVLTVCPCECERKREELQQKREEARCRKAEDEKNAGLCGIPKRYEGAVFQNWKSLGAAGERLKTECESFAKSFETFRESHVGLILYGNLGSGKTFAACCIAHALLEKGYRVTFSSVADYISLSSSSSEMAALKERMDESDLVVLDDIGAERNTSYGGEKVYALVNGLYCAEKCVIVTTNYAISDIKGDSRTLNRILEMCHPLQFVTPNARNDAAARRFEKIQRLLDGGDGV